MLIFDGYRYRDHGGQLAHYAHVYVTAKVGMLWAAARSVQTCWTRNVTIVHAAQWLGQGLKSMSL
jgi:hypothetical protein